MRVEALKSLRWIPSSLTSTEIWPTTFSNNQAKFSIGLTLFSTIQNFSVIADSRKTTLFPSPAVQLCCQASNFLASPSFPLPLTSARKHQLSAAFRERHSKSKNHTFHGLTFFSSFCCCSSSIINVTRDDNCCDRRSRKCFPCCLIFSDNNAKTYS